MQQTKMTLQELIDTAEARLADLNYSQKAIYDFHRCWLDLLSYAEERNEKYFSVELGEKYLLERRGIDVLADESTLGLTRSMIRPYKRAIYLLADLQKSGVVLRKRRMERTEVPARFAPILEHYLVMARSRYNSEGTVAGKEFIIKQFLLHVDQKNIQDLKQLTHQDITSFLETTVTWARRTVATTICYLRQFISFLYEEEYIEIDLAKGMPAPNHGRSGRLPNVWSPEDIKKVLASVDRASPIGKRDYAILLLVTHLGLRDSDVQNMTFSNLLWKECRIRLVQTKTKRILELPLTEEIGSAIIDYLKYGRPKQDTSEYVFVRHSAPYGPCFNYYHIMKAYLRRSGLSFDTEKTHGLHTLRHTLASRLLEQDVPLQTISEILGHASVGSTKAYLQIDIHGLRKCALNPDEVCADGRE